MHVRDATKLPRSTRVYSLNYPPSFLFRYLERLVRSFVYLPFNFKVATGAGNKETIPMVIKLPKLVHTALLLCGERPYSLLGLGDILVPGNLFYLRT